MKLYNFKGISLFVRASEAYILGLHRQHHGDRPAGEPLRRHVPVCQLQRVGKHRPAARERANLPSSHCV